MLAESIRHTGVDLSAKSLVIPNGIDTGHFEFADRWQQRDKLLSIRPLIYRGKYAIDLLLAAGAKQPESVSLSLYGRGPDQQLIAQQAKAMLDTLQFNLNAEFINHQDIPGIHCAHGIYLAVTRMDAQGVSMCEAMASGLPTLSFDTCAIAEFIHHNETGLLADAYDVAQFSGFIDELRENRHLFDTLAVNGRAAMEAIDISKTTRRELSERL
jgi:glycosyltransferase involved in cell wall biosynthesis